MPSLSFLCRTTSSYRLESPTFFFTIACSIHSMSGLHSEILDGDNCSLCSADLGLLDSDYDQDCEGGDCSMTGKKPKSKKSPPDPAVSTGEVEGGNNSAVSKGKPPTKAENKDGRKLTRTEARRLAEAKKAAVVAREALPLVRKRDDVAHVSPALLDSLRTSLPVPPTARASPPPPQEDPHFEEALEGAAALAIDGTDEGLDQNPSGAISAISCPPSTSAAGDAGTPMATGSSVVPLDWTQPQERPATYEELLAFVQSASVFLGTRSEDPVEGCPPEGGSPPSKRAASEESSIKPDKFDTFPFTAFIHKGETRGSITREEFVKVTTHIDKAYGEALSLGGDPHLEADGHGFEENKDGRPSRGFITCLDQASFDWVEEVVSVVELDGGCRAKAWPWPQRAPKISSSFPWQASLFVPPFFPFPEDTFLKTLKDKHKLLGTAGELSITERSARNGREGSFYKFGIDNDMRESLKSLDYVLRFSIHRTTVFVSPNRNFPGHKDLVPQSSEPRRPRTGPTGPAPSSGAMEGADNKSQKTKRNARKRKRAAERRRSRINDSQSSSTALPASPAPVPSPPPVVGTQPGTRSSASPEPLPDKCVEPEVFWTLSRPERSAYRSKILILLGRVPEQYVCPTPDDCLSMNAARRLREEGHPVQFTLTYPEAVTGTEFRANKAAK